MYGIITVSHESEVCGMNSEEFLGEKLYRVGRVVVDKSLHTQSADERFFSYFGNDVIYSIRRTIDDEDYERLIGCIDSADDGDLHKTVIRMKGINGYLRWISASVRRIGKDDAEPLFSIP